MYERNAAIAHDTEDRNWWYLHGVNLEDSFVRICTQHLSINAMINPEKRHNKYAPDLKVDGNLADLKTQNTPFFTARKYGLDPQYTLTFNRKDYERYKAQYPFIDIYVWLDWRQTEGFGARVNYLGGIFRLPFSEVARLIEAGAKEHHYLRRQDPNDRNAKSSFLLDIREFEELFRADDAFVAVPTFAKSQTAKAKLMSVADIVVPF